MALLKIVNEDYLADLFYISLFVFQAGEQMESRKRFRKRLSVKKSDAASFNRSSTSLNSSSAADRPPTDRQTLLNIYTTSLHLFQTQV